MAMQLEIEAPTILLRRDAMCKSRSMSHVSNGDSSAVSSVSRSQVRKTHATQQ